MKAGKSSLLTEILKDFADDPMKDILPSATTRCTARATIVKYGTRLSFQVADGPIVPMLSYNDPLFVNAVNLDEEARKDPELVKQIVTLYLPKQLLACGIEFIDLPGKMENDAIDQVVSKLLPTVDLVIYLFKSNSEFTSYDEDMVHSILENTQATLLVCPSQVDTLYKDKFGQVVSHAQFNQVLETLFSTVCKTHGKAKANGYKNSNYFAPISVHVQSQYHIYKYQLVEKIILLARQAVVPMKTNILLQLSSSCEKMLDAFTEIGDDFVEELIDKLPLVETALDKELMAFKDELSILIKDQADSRKADILGDLVYKQYKAVGKELQKQIVRDVQTRFMSLLVPVLTEHREKLEARLAAIQLNVVRSQQCNNLLVQWAKLFDFKLNTEKPLNLFFLGMVNNCHFLMH